MFVNLLICSFYMYVLMEAHRQTSGALLKGMTHNLRAFCWISSPGHHPIHCHLEKFTEIEREQRSAFGLSCGLISLIGVLPVIREAWQYT